MLEIGWGGVSNEILEMEFAREGMSKTRHEPPGWEYTMQRRTDSMTRERYRMKNANDNPPIPCYPVPKSLTLIAYASTMHHHSTCHMSPCYNCVIL